MSESQAGSLPPVAAHLAVPSIARVYDYLLGGTTNWEVDRQFAHRMLDEYPVMRRIALMQHRFAARVVRWLCSEGVYQFLDIGAGVPSVGATHELADDAWGAARSQRDCRVIYVDNDPVAVAHAQLALDHWGDRRRHGVVEADLRAPDELWQQVVDMELFDFDQPVAVLLIGVLHLQQLDADGHEIGPDSVWKLRERMPLGSYVAFSHVTHEGIPTRLRAKLAGLKRFYDASENPVVCRSRSEIEALLGHFEMVSPGWSAANNWQAGDQENDDPWRGSPSTAVLWAGVGKKV